MSALYRISKTVGSAFLSVLISTFCVSTSAVCDESHEHQHQHQHQHEDGHEHDHSDKASRQHSAHEHGAANLNLVLEGKTLQMEILLPAVDVCGFAHPPRTSQEKLRESEAVAMLKNSEKMFPLEKSAGCSALSVEVSNSRSEGHKGEDGHEHGDEHSEHSEYRAVYQFHCSDPEALAQINVSLFTHFPSVSKIRTNAVITGRQRALTHTKGQNSIAIAQ